MVVFVAIGLFAVRGVWWWAIAVPPLLVDVLPERDDSKASAGIPLLNAAIVGLVALLAVAFLPWWRGGGAGISGGGISDAPRELTVSLRRTLPLHARLFNPQRVGSWLEFALPGDRVFVDSRIEIYPASVWRQYSAVSLGRSDWKAILDRWNVDVAIASREDQKWLIPQILRDPGWKLIFRDASFLAFRRLA
jgi:hypothetical protein